MTTPAWALTVAYWLHMLATVAWIGSLAALSILILPAAQRTLDDQALSDLLGRVQQRLEPLGWFSILLLVGTGLVQMSANVHYSGFLSINNQWSAAILVKHLVFIVMTAISAYLTWGVMPGLRRVALRQARGLEAPEAGRIRRQEVRLLQVNLVLGLLILALTALARAS